MRVIVEIDPVGLVNVDLHPSFDSPENLHGVGKFWTLNARVPCECRSHQGICHIVRARQCRLCDKIGFRQGSVFGVTTKDELDVSGGIGQDCKMMHVFRHLFTFNANGESFNVRHFERIGGTIWPRQGCWQEQGVFHLLAKLFERSAKRLGMFIDVHVIRLDVGNGRMGWMEVMKTPVKLVGLNHVPSCSSSRDVIAS